MKQRPLQLKRINRNRQRKEIETWKLQMVHWAKPRAAVAFARSKRIDGLMRLEIELSLSKLAIEYPIVCLSFHFPRNYFRAFIGETKSMEKGVVSKKWEGGREDGWKVEISAKFHGERRVRCGWYDIPASKRKSVAIQANKCKNARPEIRRPMRQAHRGPARPQIFAFQSAVRGNNKGK